MITKTETRKIKRSVYIIHASLIIVASVINGALTLSGILLSGIVSFSFGCIVVIITQYVAKQFMNISRRKKIFSTICSFLNKGNYASVIPTLEENYKNVIDKYLMRKCFYLTGKKEEYKTFKLKAKLHNKALDKKRRTCLYLKRS